MGWWVKGDTLTSAVYESREHRRTTVGRLEYETEDENRSRASETETSERKVRGKQRLRAKL